MPRSRLLACAALVAVFPISVPAQSVTAGGPSLWDLLKPEYLVQRMLQAGVVALRTQMDIKYGDMAVDLRLGQVSLSDVRIWPLFDHDTDGECAITIDRLVVRAAPLDRPDLIRFKAQAQGMTAPAACLPPQPRKALPMTGLTELNVPRVTLDLEYDIADASADVHAYARVTGFAALDLTGAIGYLSVDGRDDMEEPTPVVYLRSATLTAENLGGWEAMRGMIPAPFTDPAQAPAILEGLLGQAIGGINRGAAAPGAEGDPSALNAAQTAFIDSVKAAAPAFLANPGKIVLETGFPPSDDVFIDFLSYESNPRLAFSDLQPVVSLAPAATRAALPAGLVAQALGEGKADLDEETLARVGTALITGTGAPRNIAVGRTLLEPLAQAGNGAAAFTLSEALEPTEPAASYLFALLAGQQSISGAAARLDRLEGRLPFAEVLDIQSTAVGDVQHPIEALQRVTLMREEAEKRLSGVGQIRSYSIAALWAIMAKAAGDSEGADILAQIDERVRMSDDDGRAAWAGAEAAASNLAMDAWIGQDLPARFGGSN